MDRTVRCDQDAFDVLYERYIEDARIGKHWRGDVSKKVAILSRWVFASLHYVIYMSMIVTIPLQRCTQFRPPSNE